MKTLKHLALAAALVVASGCGSSSTTPKTDGAITTPDGGMVTPDGGTTGDGGPTSIGLVDFVTGLVKNSTNATALPDTVDDKTITDTTDPAAFDSLLGP